MYWQFYISLKNNLVSINTNETISLGKSVQIHSKSSETQNELWHNFIVVKVWARITKVF